MDSAHLEGRAPSPDPDVFVDISKVKVDEIYVEALTTLDRNPEILESLVKTVDDTATSRMRPADHKRAARVVALHGRQNVDRNAAQPGRRGARTKASGRPPRSVRRAERKAGRVRSHRDSAGLRRSWRAAGRGAHDAGAVRRASRGRGSRARVFEARKGLPSRAKPGERYVGITVEHRVLGELPDC